MTNLILSFKRYFHFTRNENTKVFRSVQWSTEKQRWKHVLNFFFHFKIFLKTHTKQMQDFGINFVTFGLVNSLIWFTFISIRTFWWFWPKFLYDFWCNLWLIIQNKNKKPKNKKIYKRNETKPNQNKLVNSLKQQILCIRNE